MSRLNAEAKTHNGCDVNSCAHCFRRKRRSVAAGWIIRDLRMRDMDAHHGRAPYQENGLVRGHSPSSPTPQSDIHFVTIPQAHTARLHPTLVP